jgi:hypothetical protein
VPVLVDDALRILTGFGDLLLLLLMVQNSLQALRVARFTRHLVMQLTICRFVILVS